MLNEVTLHRTPGISNDVNNGLHIEGIEPSAGGAHATYVISYAPKDEFAAIHDELVFQTLERNGLTNEALLAVVMDRLTRFQAGPHSCNENATALRSLYNAMGALKARTKRRQESGTEGKLVEDTPVEASCLVQSRVHGPKPLGSKTLAVGKLTLTADDLAQWKTWGLIESEIKGWKARITEFEMETLREVASEIGSGATNGFAELTSALARTQKV